MNFEYPSTQMLFGGNEMSLWKNHYARTNGNALPLYDNYITDEKYNSGISDYQNGSEIDSNSFTNLPNICDDYRTRAILQPTSCINFQYQSIFNKYSHFNIVQSSVLKSVLHSDNSLVVSSPTGSGKTCIMELGIVKLLMDIEYQQTQFSDVDNKMDLPKIIYIAPLKALVSERYYDWSEKFKSNSLNCVEITGDTFHDDLKMFQNSRIILTTPEKLDSLTRRWKDNESIMKSIKLMLIDEVHLLKEEIRGPTLEAVVSRMKTMQSIYHKNYSMRMIAVSATIPNVEDVAAWLSCGNCNGLPYAFDESVRPVQLRKVVLGFSCSSSWTDYRFDISLNYKVAAVIDAYSNDKPTLIFASTRKGTVQTAAVLAKEQRFVRNMEHKMLLCNVANEIHDNKLKEFLLFGVGFHHAGIDIADRKIIETLFIEGNLYVLVSTSTLAMGVNLPAHLVIIKSTSQYINGTSVEYSSSQILQMVGRAGRPQFDTHATSVIMTKSQMKGKYENLVTGKDLLESHLNKHLVEHLNAEVVLGTIRDISVAVEWLRSTFFYVRVQKNPKFYGFPLNMSLQQLESKLQDMCQREINALSSARLIEVGEFDIKSTLSGRLMARYCISFQTMKTFLELKGDECLKELMEMLSKCQEYADIKLRVSDKRPLNELNKTATRFPISGKIKTKTDKISCLLQSVFSSVSPGDFGLVGDSTKIIRIGQRLSKCLYEYSFSRKEYDLLLNTTILAKSFSCQLWETSKHVAKQFPKIGPILAKNLVSAKLTSFDAIENTDPRNIELICNRHPPFGNKLREQTLKLPRYEIILQQLNETVTKETSKLLIVISLANFSILQSGNMTTPKNHSCLLLLGDADNKVIFAQRITDVSLLQNKGQVTREISVTRAAAGDEILINFISETWAGLDVQSAYTPRYTDFHSQRNEVHLNNEESKQKQDPSIIMNSRSCHHTCSNRQSCKHQCCKVGVIVRNKSNKSLETKTHFPVTHLPDPVPSVVKIKTKLNQSQKAPLNLAEFKFVPSRPKFQIQRETDPCVNENSVQHPENGSRSYYSSALNKSKMEENSLKNTSASRQMSSVDHENLPNFDLMDHQELDQSYPYDTEMDKSNFDYNDLDSDKRANNEKDSQLAISTPKKKVKSLQFDPPKLNFKPIAGIKPTLVEPILNAQSSNPQTTGITTPRWDQFHTRNPEPNNEKSEFEYFSKLRSEDNVRLHSLYAQKNQIGNRNPELINSFQNDCHFNQGFGAVNNPPLNIHMQPNQFASTKVTGPRCQKPFVWQNPVTTAAVTGMPLHMRHGMQQNVLCETQKQNASERTLKGILKRTEKNHNQCGSIVEDLFEGIL